MRRTALLVLAGGVAFVAAATAFLPARAFHAVVLQPRGVEAAMVTGTVWNGQWHDVRVGSVELAHVRGAVSARSLVTGRPAVNLAITDPRGRAEGIVILAGQGVELRGLSGRILPSGFVSISGPGRAALNEPVMFSDVQGVFGARGCEALSGSVRHGGLLALDTAGAGALPVLDGALECAGSLPALRFAGESQDVRIDGHVRLGLRSAGWSLSAGPRSETMALALRAIGFQGDGATLTAQGQTGWD